MPATLSSLVESFFRNLASVTSSQRVRVSFSVTKKEARLLLRKRAQLGAKTNAEVVRLALAWLLDVSDRGQSINRQLSNLADDEKVSYEFEASGKAVGCLRTLASRLKLKSSAEVIRVAINNFCYFDPAD